MRISAHLTDSPAIAYAIQTDVYDHKNSFLSLVPVRSNERKPPTCVGRTNLNCAGVQWGSTSPIAIGHPHHLLSRVDFWRTWVRDANMTSCTVNSCYRHIFGASNTCLPVRNESLVTGIFGRGPLRDKPATGNFKNNGAGAFLLSHLYSNKKSTTECRFICCLEWYDLQLISHPLRRSW